jgi:tetratricopeptide (TPR) repeat protein
MLSSTFVHLNTTHLLRNLSLLLVLGIYAEQVFRKQLFLVLYLSCGVAGSIASLGAVPEMIICGASASVFGLFGAMLSAYFLGKVALSKAEWWVFGFVAILMGYTLYAGAVTPEIANSAHVAGLILGSVFGMLAASNLAAEAKFRHWMCAATALVLVLGTISVRHYRGYVVSLAAASQAIDKDKPDEVLADVSLVLQKDPGSSTANAFAAAAYLRKSDPADAETAARRALSTDPDNGLAQWALGMVYVQTGRREQARSLAIQMFLRKRNTQEAVEILTACEADVIDVSTGDALLDAGKPDFAIAFYKKALAFNPNNDKAQLGLAKAYQKKAMQTK